MKGFENNNVHGHKGYFAHNALYAHVKKISILIFYLLWKHVLTTHYSCIIVVFDLSSLPSLCQIDDAIERVQVYSSTLTM